MNKQLSNVQRIKVHLKSVVNAIPEINWSVKFFVRELHAGCLFQFLVHLVELILVDHQFLCFEQGSFNQAKLGISNELSE